MNSETVSEFFLDRSLKIAGFFAHVVDFPTL